MLTLCQIIKYQFQIDISDQCDILLLIMSVEIPKASRIASEPINRTHRLGDIGLTVAYTGAPVFYIGGMGGSLVVAGAGLATCFAGYGLVWLDEIRNAEGRGNQPEIGRIQNVETIGDLQGPGAVEDLTRQGRIVMVVDGSSGTKGDPNYKETSLLFVPPPGISFGDKAWQAPGVAFEFFYAGQSKGYAKLLEVDRPTARLIQQRQNEILERIGRREGPFYSFISDEERERMAPNPLDAKS